MRDAAAHALRRIEGEKIAAAKRISPRVTSPRSVSAIR